MKKFTYYFLSIIFLPLSLYRFIKEVYIFNRNVKIMKTVINDNNEFFNYLDSNGFSVDLIGRLYSAQHIPLEFQDFTEDELYDVVMRAIVTSLQHILNKNILLDVVGITTRKKSKEIYLLNITSNNEQILRTSYKLFIGSLILNAIILILILI